MGFGKGFISYKRFCNGFVKGLWRFAGPCSGLEVFRVQGLRIRVQCSGFFQGAWENGVLSLDSCVCRRCKMYAIRRIRASFLTFRMTSD